MPYRPVLPARKTTPKGTVYLLHFDKPYKHAQHYIGFTEDFRSRMAAHQNGNGSRLVAVAKAAGCVVSVALTMEDVDLTVEYRMKNRGGARRWCPMCRKK